MDIVLSFLYISIFPGLLFLITYGLFLEWTDRKLSAIMQNRVGPPYYQTLADFIKLTSKEIIIPDNADVKMFKALPYISMAAITTSILFIPVYSKAIYPFSGDLILVIYLLTIPTATFFLAGYSSTSPYATLGSIRVMTQLFGYEVPLLLSIIGPSILAGSFSITEISNYFYHNPKMIIFNILGFFVSILALQGKLERVPFDTPHAKNEIVGGQFTEYSGLLLAFFNLSINMEMVVGASLINAIFLGGLLNLSGYLGFFIFILKTFIIVFILILFKVLMARVRIDQMINFCWKYLAPLALIQIIIDIILKYRG